MKRVFRIFLFCIIITCLELGAVKREQRAVWMTPFLKDWPTGVITENNVDLIKMHCRQALDTLQLSNMTTIYYHVRSACDAVYDSKYEPWADCLTGTRGQVPAFDPFEYLLNEAHKRGIEVYAWLNPYRYYNSTGDGWGSNGGDKNYENSHPDWLLTQRGERNYIVLNPGLPEVKQRIVDVIADIMSKYDIDGVIFDDYFYPGGLSMNADADLYAAYKAEGGTLAQDDWRRENVNDMVRMVNDYIKNDSGKPWVRFGIGPAGVACSDPNVAEQYGVSPCPGSDWQYTSIFSDPMAWVSRGTIDFVAPQVYWMMGSSTVDFSLVAPWWYDVTAKFNRHCYISQTLDSDESNVAPLSEFSDQIDLIRTSDQLSSPGLAFFAWHDLRERRGSFNGKRVKLSYYLRSTVYETNALSPAIAWMPATCPGAITDLQRNGRTLSWNGPQNVRYAIYFVPKTVETKTFRKEEEYLHILAYNNTYEIPDVNKNYPGFGIADTDLENYNYAIAIVDRYGNEYSAYFVDETPVIAEKPVPSFPVQNVQAPAAFNFRWDGNASIYEIIVADDAEMKNILAKKEVSANFVPSAEVWHFEADKTYYWKVISRHNNAIDVESDVNAFTVDVFRVLSPVDGATNCDDNLMIEWLPMENAKFHVAISTSADMNDVVYETDAVTSFLQVPHFKLMGGTTYYLQIVATIGEVSFSSDVVSFSVKTIPGAVPEFLNPAEEGVTLYSNSKIQIKPQPGVMTCTIGISASNTFPSRSSYAGTFSDFQFETKELSELKVGSSYLKDGETYYVRANVGSLNENGVRETTDWTVSSFVYSAEAGVKDVVDKSIYIRGGEVPTVVTGQAGLEVSLYSVDGKLLLTTTTDAAGEVRFSDLRTGVYLVSVRLSDGSVKTLKMIC